MTRTLAYLAFAEVADFGTSYFASARGAHEGNPVFLAAVGAGLVSAFVFTKIGVVPVVGVVVSWAPTPRARRIVQAAVRFGATMLLGVAAANVLVAL